MHFYWHTLYIGVGIENCLLWTSQQTDRYGDVGVYVTSLSFFFFFFFTNFFFFLMRME